MRRVLVLLMLVGCSKTSAPDASTMSPASSPAAQSDEQRAILPLAGNEEHVACCARGSYAPTVADLAAFDAALPKALEKTLNRRTNEPLSQRAPAYKRQYIGYVGMKGQRWIHASFHCQVPSSIGEG